MFMIEYSMRQTVYATLEPTIGAQPGFRFPIRIISWLLVTLEPDNCSLQLREVVRILQVFASWLQLESNSTSFCDSALPWQIPCSVLWKGKVQLKCQSYIMPQEDVVSPDWRYSRVTRKTGSSGEMAPLAQGWSSQTPFLRLFFCSGSRFATSDSNFCENKYPKDWCKWQLGNGMSLPPLPWVQFL